MINTLENLVWNVNNTDCYLVGRCLYDSSFFWAFSSLDHTPWSAIEDSLLLFMQFSSSENNFAFLLFLFLLRFLNSVDFFYFNSIYFLLSEINLRRIRQNFWHISTKAWNFVANSPHLFQVDIFGFWRH